MTNVYDFDLARKQYDAASALSTTSEITPDDAARAFDLSKLSGMPATVVQPDMKSVEDDILQRNVHDLVSNNPYLSTWLNPFDSHPLNGPLAKDDIHNLDRLSSSVQSLSSGGMDGDAFQAAADRIRRAAGPKAPHPLTTESDSNLIDMIPGLGALFADEAQLQKRLDFRDQAFPPSSEQGYMLSDMFGIPRSALQPSELGTIGQMGVGLLRLGSSALESPHWAVRMFYTYMQASPNEQIRRAGRELAAVAEQYLLTGEPFPGYVAGAAGQEAALAARSEQIQQFIRDADELRTSREKTAEAFRADVIRGTARAAGPALPSPEMLDAREGFARVVADELDKTQPFYEAHQPPPVGVSPLADSVRVIQAPLDQELIDATLGDVEATELKTRSPDKLKEFLDLHDAGQIAIEKEAILASPDRWSWIPNLQRQLAGVGDMVYTPASDFIVNYDRANWEKDKNSIARGNNLTQNQAQDIIVYHGTRHTLEGDRFSDRFLRTGEGAAAFGEGHYLAEEPDVAGTYRVAGVGRELGKGTPEREAFDAIIEAQGDSPDATPEQHRANAIGQLQHEINTIRQQAAVGEGKDLKWIRGTPEEHVARAEAALNLLRGGYEVPKGNLYQAKITRPKEHFLDRDLPLHAQSDHVKQILAANKIDTTSDVTGEHFYNSLSLEGRGIDDPGTGALYEENAPKVSKALQKAGIAGMKYKDEFSRGIPTRTQLEAQIERAKTDHAQAVENLRTADAQIGEGAPTTQQREVLRSLERHELDMRGVLARLETELVHHKEPTRNYVVFNPDDITITHKNGEPVEAKDQAAVKEEALGLKVLERGRSGRPIRTEPLSKGDRLEERTQRLLEGILQSVGLGPDGNPGGPVGEVMRTMGPGVRRETMARRGRKAPSKVAEVMPFEEGKAVGLTDKEMEALIKKIEETTIGNKKWVKKQAEAQFRLEKTNRWKEEYNLLEPAMRAEVEVRPHIRAWLALQKQKINPMYLTGVEKQDLHQLVGMGTDPVAAIPDQVAKDYGYQTGADLIQDMRTLARQAEGFKGNIIDRIVKQELTELVNFSQGKSPVEKINAAIDQALGLSQMDLLHENVVKHAMQMGLNRPPWTKQTMKWMAANELGQRLYGGVRGNPSITYTSVAAEAFRAGRKYMQSWASGNYVKALQDVEDWYIKVEMAKQMRDVEKLRGELTRLAKKHSKREVKDFPIEHHNFIQQLLSQVGMNIDRAPMDLVREIAASKYKSLDEFITHLQQDLGASVPVSAELRAGRPTPLDKMTVAQFEQFVYALRALDKDGRDLQKVSVAGQMMDLRDVVDEGFGKVVLKLPFRQPRASTPQGILTKIGRALGPELFWGLIKTETVINRFMGWDPRGIFLRAFIYPLADGANLRADLIREYSNIYKKEVPAMGVMAARKSVRNDIFFNPRILRESQGQRKVLLQKMSVADAAGVLANMGNKSNADKFLRGYYILDADGNPDYARVFKWLADVLPKEFWDRQQIFYDKIIKPLKEKADANDRALDDVPAENLPFHRLDSTAVHDPSVPDQASERYRTATSGLTIKDKDGVLHPINFDGWYHPLIPHEEFEGGRSGEFRLQTNDYFRASTPRSYEKERTEAIYPLTFTWGRVEFTISEMIHDIAMRGPVRNFQKFLQDRRARDIWSNHFNVETLHGAEEWLMSISNAMAGQGRFMQKWADVVSYFRMGAVGSQINMNVSTAFKHLPTALAAGVTRAGLLPMLEAYWDLYGNLWSGYKNRQFAKNTSGELRKRGEHFQRVTGHDMMVFSNRRGVMDMLSKLWGTMLKAADGFSSKATWWAVFKPEFRKHGDLDLARQIADAAVRDTHGSTDVTGLPPITASKNPAVRFFAREYLPFQTTLNSFFQMRYESFARMRDGWRQWREDGWTKAWQQSWWKVPRIELFFGFVFFIGLAVKELAEGPPVTRAQVRKEEEKTKIPWWLYSALGSLETYSGINELMNYFYEMPNSAFGLLGSTFESWRRSKDELERATRQYQQTKNISPDEWAYLIEAIGSGVSPLLLGIPGKPVSRGIAGEYRREHGLEAPKNIVEEIRLWMRGKVEPQRPRPRERRGGRSF